VCRCGNAGCLEAVAGGRALANRLHELGHPVLIAASRKRFLGALLADPTGEEVVATRFEGSAYTSWVPVMPPNSDCPYGYAGAEDSPIWYSMGA